MKQNLTLDFEQISDKCSQILSMKVFFILKSVKILFEMFKFDRFYVYKYSLLNKWQTLFDVVDFLWNRKMQVGLVQDFLFEFLHLFSAINKN